MRSFNMECNNCCKILTVDGVDQIIKKFKKGSKAGEVEYSVECDVCKCHTQVPNWATKEVERALMPILVFELKVAELA